MWTVLKLDKNKLQSFRKDLTEKVGSDFILYNPKIEIKLKKKNKLIIKEINLLNNYYFCYHKNFKNNKFLHTLKYLKGLKECLTNYVNSQDEIQKFIANCKENENDNGFLHQDFLDLHTDTKYKFCSGPFSGLVFDLIKIQKNNIKILLGKLKATIGKKDYLFNPV